MIKYVTLCGIYNVGFRNIRLVSRFYSTNIKMKSSSFDYCLNLVKTRDYENYLCTLLLPNKLRSTGIILRAFNVEIASVQDQITNVLAGEMRFKFWDCAIDDVYKNASPEHPVCVQLSKIISQYQLPKLYMKRLITARYNNFKNPIFSDLQSVENYGEHSIATLNYLLLQCADIKNIDADHAASHLSKAQCIVNVLRGVQYFSHRNSVRLPRDILLKHNVSEESILRGKCDKNIKDAAFEIASRAHLHLEKMKNIKKTVNKSCRLIYLPSVPIEIYLKKLRSVDFDIFNPTLQTKNTRLPFQLYWKKYFI